MTEPQKNKVTPNNKRSILPYVVGSVFVLATWIVYATRDGTIYVPINGLLMVAVFGYILPSDDAKVASVIFPIVQAWLVVLLLRRTKSIFIWIIVILFLVLITIPFLGYAKMD